ncbi:hypothetical protein PC117_g12718 [Phytophthora cactorum]|uniref:Uncharacterized protein n=1 Tax=Phytophthora cactorum TaxID=29920 RepID=A0A8T1D602_9STRA|nr:hypothetical protein PC117_g12718 [Phytophthora cactorum]
MTAQHELEVLKFFKLKPLLFSFLDALHHGVPFPMSSKPTNPQDAAPKAASVPSAIKEG